MKKTIIQKDTYTPVLTAAVFSVARMWNSLKCPSTEKWVKMHICTLDYYSVIKKDETMPSAATWMDLEIVMLSEVKSNRERQTSHDIAYMWNL